MSFEFIRKLPTPTDIKRDFPVPERVAELKKERDKEIFNKYSLGVSVKILSEEYFLTESSIRRIIRNQRKKI